MVRDRGTLKWSSIMLSEHINALRDLWEKVDHKEKPIIDEQKKEEMHNLLYEAFENKLKIEVIYYKNYEYKKVVGYIDSVNVLNQVIKVNGEQINIDDLLDVQII